MNKFLIFGLVVAAITFSSTYWVYTGRVDMAEEEVKTKGLANRQSFLSSKELYLRDFSEKYPRESHLFLDYFDAVKAKVEKDTVVNFFIYRKPFSIESYHDQYLTCLWEKCESVMMEQAFQEELERKLKSLRYRYGDLVDKQFERLGDDKFSNYEISGGDCATFFDSVTRRMVSETAFKEFESILQAIESAQKEASKANDRAERDLQSAIRSASQRLTRQGVNMLQQELKQKILFVEHEIQHNYSGDLLGQVAYSVISKEFDKGKLLQVVDEVTTTQYRNNSLATGATPYRYCYGGNLSCSGYYCSTMTVVTPSNSDVMVTIKSGDRVVRHAYIKANDSYNFELPNGTYQPFFYYGKGWNPAKFMKTAFCGDLLGGFIADVHVGKDSPQRLESVELTYRLVLQQNGNFSTKPSSVGEAL